MKVLRNTEWEPVGHLEYFNPSGGPVYLFRHKRWSKEIVALEAAKFVDVTANIVYIYDAWRQNISVSYSSREQMECPPTRRTS